jgi:non-specific serine/threonine protein kinase
MAAPLARARLSRLPAEVTSFVGRRRELTEVKRVLEGTRLLTLTGAGGSGKTRLALRVARDAARVFPNGVCLAELAPLRDPAVLVHALFQALDLRDQTSRWPLATLLDYLAGKRLLLVLDNCEHVLNACAVLVDALLRGCLELRILATSRQALDVPGETTYRVNALSLPEVNQQLTPATWRAYEALALFEDRAAAVDPTFRLTDANASTAADICCRLDGNHSRSSWLPSGYAH